jgi:hypothetical protein
MPSPGWYGKRAKRGLLTLAPAGQEGGQLTGRATEQLECSGLQCDDFPRTYFNVSEQEAHYEAVLRDAVAVVPGAEQDMGHGPGLALLLALAFSYPLTFVKNHTFVQEGEWRLMRLDFHLDATPNPKVRDPGIRYEEVALDSATTGESAIICAVAGSAACPESIEEARHWLDQCGLAYVPVYRSTSSP